MRPLPLAAGLFVLFSWFFLLPCLPWSFLLSGWRGVLFPKGALAWELLWALLFMETLTVMLAKWLEALLGE